MSTEPESAEGDVSRRQALQTAGAAMIAGLTASTVAAPPIAAAHLHPRVTVPHSVLAFRVSSTSA